MALSQRAREARNRYFRERRKARLETAAGRRAQAEREERYWSKIADRYEAAEAARKEKR